jgi:non-specific serine/threonine protein kinase
VTAPRRSNLPHPLSSFIGRQRELAQLSALLAQHALVTLTGPGGVGKTRLAIEVARSTEKRFADGAWLVELAPLADAQLVPQFVAAVLGVREHPGRPLSAVLADALQSRQVLIVLDNCEHIVAACADLAHTLLRSCPDVRILSTSREALGVTGEAVWLDPR